MYMYRAGEYFKTKITLDVHLHECVYMHHYQETNANRAVFNYHNQNQSKDTGQSQNYIMSHTIPSTNQNSKEIHVADMKDGKHVQVNIGYD